MPGEVVIQKTKPSAFYGTALTSFLTGLKVDQKEAAAAVKAKLNV